MLYIWYWSCCIYHSIGKWCSIDCILEENWYIAEVETVGSLNIGIINSVSWSRSTQLVYNKSCTGDLVFSAWISIRQLEINFILGLPNFEMFWQFSCDKKKINEVVS